MSHNSATLTPAFQAMHRNRLTPVGQFENIWHFSLREKNFYKPGYTLFIVNPSSGDIAHEGALPPSFANMPRFMRAHTVSIMLQKAF
ncbi:MAG: hypothetical protein Q9218_006606, partial [Villophora microphyllina]